MALSRKTNRENIGIIGMELYYPRKCVRQHALEKYDGVSQGKYTVGLGQTTMSFCDDREDIISICLTVLAKLVKNYKIDYTQIGRLEVGTETILDHSKSVKTNLMQLFEESGNTDVEGLDTTNACYGGTQALFNSLAWIESSAYDGRYAVVICADIAVYAAGPARPTGGVAGCAMLVGPGAPIVVHSTARVSHFRHAYDFYKAEMCSEYPTVDGSLSINCYFEAIEVNYSRYVAKQRCLSAGAESHRDVSCSGSPLDWIADFYCFHSPFTKLVRKSFARMLHSDFKADPNCFKFEGVQESADRDKTFLALSEKQFCEKVEPSLLLAKELGNTYTASLYCGLISLIAARGRNLCGKKACMFSYGSGFASSMFPVEFCDPEAQVYRHFEGLAKELELRLVVSPEVFVDTLKKREEAHGMAPYRPTGSVDDLASGSYYLEAVDEKRRRTYCLKQ